MSIEQILARIERAHPRLIDLSLDRLRGLLSRLDHPERRLPPVIHVAGTNGKGSTCAFLRAMAEAAHLRAHVYTSPHLVHMNERIRLAGTLVSEDELTASFEHVERINGDAAISVFEITTAAAFELFAATPADICILEVGLGGRADATNVIETAAACAITSISLDHRELLGPTVEIIAREKAGIMKPGVPVAIGAQTAAVMEVLLREAASCDAVVRLRGRDWDVSERPDGSLCYQDETGSMIAPVPALPGRFQFDNAGIAVTALRSSRLRHDVTGLSRTQWPARLQRLLGPLASQLPSDWELWLDGGHNPGAGVVLAEHLNTWADRPLHLIIGMRQAKHPADFLRPLLPLAATVWAVQEPEQHSALAIADIVAASGGIARPGPRVADALHNIPRDHTPARVLICGSLYLAGVILKLDGAA